MAARLHAPTPDVALISGFGAGEAEEVLAAYATSGLACERRLDRDGWQIACSGELRRGVTARVAP